MTPDVSSPTGKRGVVTVPAVLLVIVLLGIVAMVVYRFLPKHERSPFALFRVAPGMSRKELEKTVTAVPGSKVDCRDDPDVRRYCVLKFPSDPGFVAALLDRHDRVMIVEAVAVLGRNGLALEADSAQAAWNRVATPQPVPPRPADGDTGAVRWTSPDRRWTAELHYAGVADPDHPRMVLLEDTRAVEALAQSSPHAATRARESGWTPSTWDEAAVAGQRVKKERRSEYGSMATMLAELGDAETAYWNANHTFTANISDLGGLFIIGSTEPRILTANDSGWTAEASDRRFPGITCVTYGGKVPYDQWPVTAGGAHITSVEGVACDSLPSGPLPK